MNEKRLRRFRRFIINYIYFLFALSGVREALFESTLPADVVLSLALSVAMVKFCAVDSRLRGIPLLVSFYWIIFITWPVSVPIYLLYSRGIRGIISLVLYVISLQAVRIMVFFVTIYLMWGQ